MEKQDLTSKVNLPKGIDLCSYIGHFAQPYPGLYSNGLYCIPVEIRNVFCDLIGLEAVFT